MSVHHEVHEQDLSSSESDTHPQANAPSSAISSLSSNLSSSTQPLPPLPNMRESSSTPMLTPGPRAGMSMDSRTASPPGPGMGMPLPSPSALPSHMQHTMAQYTDSYFPPPGSPPLPHPPPIMRSNTSISASVGATPRPRSVMRSVTTGNERGGGTQRGSMATSMEKAGLEDIPVSPSGRVLDLPGLHNIGRKDDRYSAMQRQVSMRPQMIYRRDPNSDLEGGINMDESAQRNYFYGEENLNVPPSTSQTVEERLKKTIEQADDAIKIYEKKAWQWGYALNFAIGMQVFLSALITALSAVTSGKRTQVMTSVLGGAGTIVASYLARARGSNEPELSITRTKDLQRFKRKCEAFVKDHGPETGLDKNGNIDNERAWFINSRIHKFREDFEHLLGNGDGERKLSPT